MKETRAKNGIKPSGDYGMWFVGGVPHRETDRMEKTISLLHRIFPVPWQHSFRDAGGAGHMFYSTVIVKAISLFLADPKLAPRFLKVNRRVTTYQYGSYPSQIIEVIHRKSPEGVHLAPKCVTVFYHGGAWGSGSPKFYRLIGDILTDSEDHTVVLVGYRIFPTGTIQDQIDDMGSALKWLEDNRDRIGLYRTVPFILAAHSSGCHVSALYLIRRALNPEQHVGHAKISGFISLNGVYDLWAQYRIEEFRGWHDISPLKPVNGPDFHHMINRSPTPVVHTQLTREAAERFPPTLLMHGIQDETVPFSHSSEFQTALLSKGVRLVRLEFLNGDHFALVKQIMMPEPGDTVLDSIRSFCQDISHIPHSKL